MLVWPQMKSGDQLILGVNIKYESQKQSLSNINMDRQLLHQKSRQKFSVMKTKKTGVSRNIVCFGILIDVLS